MIRTALLRLTAWGLVVMGCLASNAAHAWGSEGHRITGFVAWQLLDAKTRIALNRVMKGETLADASTYMDRMRPTLNQTHPGSAEWHYNDKPVCDQNGSNFNEYCENGNCASVKIGRYLKVLADEHSTRVQKAEAVRFVVHMVGDVHQPLHAATNDDRGGNLVKVRFATNDDPIKLHGAWDTTFVRDLAGGRPEAAVARELIVTHGAKVPAWQASLRADWFDESHALAREFVYRDLAGFACGADPSDTVIDVTPEYRQRAKDIVAERLAAAGARIAKLLQRALGE